MNKFPQEIKGYGKKERKKKGKEKMGVQGFEP